MNKLRIVSAEEVVKNSKLAVKTTHKNYEALVKAGAKRNNEFPVERLLKSNYLYMYTNPIIHSSCHGEFKEWDKKFELVLLQETESYIEPEPAKYDSDKGWTF